MLNMKDGEKMVSYLGQHGYNIEKTKNPTQKKFTRNEIHFNLRAKFSPFIKDVILDSIHLYHIITILEKISKISKHNLSNSNNRPWYFALFRGGHLFSIG
jgi:hypothetical protein